MTDTLKPCPYCGEQPEATQVLDSVLVQCVNEDCGLMPYAIGVTAGAAATRWNTRASEGAPRV